MSMSGWSAPEDMGTWMGDQRRQVDELARRIRVPNARQIMGPGLGPWAVRLFDWSDEKTLYNGIFYSEPGALNSPDIGLAWMGTSRATQDGRGIQEVTQISFTGVLAHPIYRRAFTTAPGQTATYGPWFAEGTWVDYTPAHPSWFEGSGGSVVGRFMIQGLVLSVRIGCIFGTGLSFPAGCTVGMPGFAYSTSFFDSQAGVDFRGLDAGSANYKLIGHLNAPNIELWGAGASGAYAGSWPFTWVAGDAWTLEAHNIRLLA